MTYRSRLIDGQNFEVAYFTNGHQHVVTMIVGEDDNPARTYSIMATFEPRLGVDTYEFTFCVMEYDVELDYEHPFWSGLDTRSKILGAERAKCIQAVCECLITLLGEVRPTHIFMQACDANLPVRARAKYERVLQIFGGAGYLIERQPPYHGRESWWLERTQA